MPWKQIWEMVFPKGGNPLVGMSTMLVAVFIVWSLGFAPVLGAGFARADDVASIQASLLETAIIDVRIRYCSAPDGSDAKRYFFKSTQEKIRAYETKTQTTFPLPPCKDLVYVPVTTAGTG